MSKFAKKVQHFWSELRRRKTVQTAVAYLILIAAVVGPANDILGGLGAPAWVLRSIIIGLLIGFPIVLVLSWVFDFTWHGFERTKDLVEESDSVADSASDPDSVVALQAEKLDADQPSISIETGTAHRHQVTLLRTSLVLANKNVVVDDPEELLVYVPELEALISAIAEKYSALELRHDGTSFEFLFGFPSAYENDAIRAVVMGLAIEEDLDQLSKEKGLAGSKRLAAISGVHSDLVVIDEDETKNRGITVVGSALQETNWVQSLGGPGSVIVDNFSYQLLRNRMHCESIGDFTNNHSGETAPVFKALELRHSELDPKVYKDFQGIFLGRNTEVELILDRWQRAKEGEDEFVVLRGEPGIGKSTIIREVTSRAQQSESALILPLFCSPLERNTAFQPIIEYLMGPGLGLRRTHSAAERTSRIQEVLKDLEMDVERAVPLVASLLSFDADDKTAFSENARRELIKYLLEMIRATAKRRHMIFIVEDLHWADPSTLEVINLMLSDASESGMLCLFTTRPTLHLPWESRSNVTTLNLQSLSKRSTRELVDNFLKDLDLPEDFIKQLVREAGGNPLFAEELAKAIFEAAQTNPDYKKEGLVLPGTLQRSLASRIDNLGKAKPLLQLCSLLGREFDYALLASVSETSDESTLQDELDVLVNAEFLYQHGTLPDNTYTFKHILMQETAYQSMLNSTRRELHERVATELEQQAGSSESISELLAYHYEGSNHYGKAVASWISAASKSLGSFSSSEAAQLAGNGLQALVKMEESTERDMLEIQLQGIRGRALLTAFGYAEPEVEQAFNRALELCDRVGDIPQLFVFLVGLWSYFQIGGSVANAENVAKRLMRLADSDDSPAKKVQALYCIGYTAYRAGEFLDALEHLNKSQQIADSSDADYTEFSPSGDDGRIHNFAILSHIYWQLGDTQEALAQSEQAVSLATRLGNPVGLVFAIFLRTWLMHLDRNFPDAVEWAEKTVVLATEKQLNFWIANSLFIKAWARYHSGRSGNEPGSEEELETMLVFISKSKQVGARFGTVGMFLETAETLAYSGRISEAQELLDEAKTLIDSTGEKYMFSELFRIQAVIYRKQGNSEKAEEQFKQALDVSESMSAVSHHKRAALHLAELYQELGKSKQAEDMLAIVSASMKTVESQDSESSLIAES